MKLQPELVSRRLRVSHQALGKSAIARIDEEGDAGRRGHQFVQQLKLVDPRRGRQQTAWITRSVRPTRATAA